MIKWSEFKTPEQEQAVIDFVAGIISFGRLLQVAPDSCRSKLVQRRKTDTHQSLQQLAAKALRRRGYDVAHGHGVAYEIV